MAIQLLEQDDRLSEVCRQAETACAGDSHDPIEVVVLPNLDQVEGREQSAAVRRSPAAGSPTQPVIYVNEPLFMKLSADEQVAVLVHEVGHFFVGGGVDGCVLADCFACERGFESVLLALRGRENGPHHQAILTEWRNPERTRRLFRRYDLLRQMGVDVPEPEELLRTKDDDLRDPVEDLTAAIADAQDDPG